MLIGEVIELAPFIKIKVPGILRPLEHPEAIVVRKLYNSKPLRRSAAALLTAIARCHSLIHHHTSLIWQPPTFPTNPVIVELLTDWEQKKHSTLILTLHPQPLRTALQEYGIKTAAVTSKQD